MERSCLDIVDSSGSATLKMVGWVARSMQTDLVLDALEQAPWSRPGTPGMVHHSDQGSRYLSIRYAHMIYALEGRTSVVYNELDFQ